MIYPLISTRNPVFAINPKTPNTSSQNPIFCCSFQKRNPNIIINKPLRSNGKTHIFNPIIVTNDDPVPASLGKYKINEERKDISQVGMRQMLVLCGLGYWVQGFRCFPWLAMNFHMAHNLNLHPSTLQLVQNSGNLPMVAKPLYGILSDALYIGGAHRIPYICIGVFLQILSWGLLALFPIASKDLSTLMGCVLLSNLGASIVEVANDALVAEYGRRHKLVSLQSYTFMVAAAGGILGNLLGGFLLIKTRSKTMFLLYAGHLSLQFVLSLSTKEGTLGLLQPLDHDVTDVVRRSIAEIIKKQLSDLITAVNEERIFRPLIWLVVSISMVPIFSGSIFCYQTQCLNIDPSVIGMSRVVCQFMLLSLTVLYEQYWKKISLRTLIGIIQVLYASSLLLDLTLVKQINLQLGIPNEVFTLLFSGIADTLAQFKLLPFSMLMASLCPQGCEGSLTSFSASALCLSSIFSGFLGVGLASMLGITSGDFSRLPTGILIQFVAALVPMVWINLIPMCQPVLHKERKRGMSKRARKNRRVGRVLLGSVFVYRRERESEA